MTAHKYIHEDDYAFVRHVQRVGDRGVTADQLEELRRLGVDTFLSTRLLMTSESIVMTHSDLPGFELAVEFDSAGKMVGFALLAPVSVEFVRWEDEPPRVLPEGGLRLMDLRKVRLFDAERAARGFATMVRASLADDLSTEIEFRDADGKVIGTRPLFEGAGMGSQAHLAAVESAVSVQQTRRMGRGEALTDRVLAENARDYCELVATGPAPIKRLAERLHIGEHTATSRIRLARQRGLLTPAPRARTGSKRGGRPGGELTPKARAVLGLA